MAERGPSAAATSSEVASDGANSVENPISSPLFSPYASSVEVSSNRNPSTTPRLRYFHSRRLRKDENFKPPVFKRNPGEKWLWINPVIGFIVGLAISGYIIYTTVSVKTYTYCPVLNEDFSSGALNPRIWSMEVEVGGFGNGEFEQTTSSTDNVFIKDGQLYIKPTLQDENLLTQDNIVNLTATGTCTAASNFDVNCVMVTNSTNGTIVQPVKSGRVNTKLGASIKYGRVEVEAKLPKGDWLWPAIWMMPVTDTYGPWPASGEIDIVEGRGNNHTYLYGGNDIISSTLHWGPDPLEDRYWSTTWGKAALHSEFGDAFHTFGLEWSDKYMFTYIDTRLLQVFYLGYDTSFWQRGQFSAATHNGTLQIDPWSQTGRPQTPFDQEFYLILNVAVGGTNGWFADGVAAKPWVNKSPTAKKDFWTAKDQWYPTWETNGQMIVNSVKMWQQC